MKTQELLVGSKVLSLEEGEYPGELLFTVLSPDGETRSFVLSGDPDGAVATRVTVKVGEHAVYESADDVAYMAEELLDPSTVGDDERWFFYDGEVDGLLKFRGPGDHTWFLRAPQTTVESRERFALAVDSGTHRRGSWP